MISKPLFKQSAKANALVWALVTFATCFMLAVIIIVIGNSEGSVIRSAMVDAFTDDYVEAQISGSAMTYYRITDTALDTYGQRKSDLDALFAAAGEDGYRQIAAAYGMLTGMGQSDEEARARIAQQSGTDRVYVDALVDYYLANGSDLSDAAVSEYVLTGVADGVYGQLIDEYGEETAAEARAMMTDAIAKYLAQPDADADEFAAAYIADMLGQTMPAVLAEQGLTYSAEEVRALAAGAIDDFRGRLLLDPDLDADALIAELSGSLLDELPDDVRAALEEIGSLDVFGLIVGQIFFKMAGLLLPIVYTIMTANNLIAGQVDSGSMAYVLSTPTRRRQVTVTQMCYLMLSLFVMFALTCVTGLASLAALKGAEAVTVTYGEMALLCLGAFVTMLAVAGICFLASVWFDRSKQAMTWGGGLSMFFLVAAILGLFGSPAMPGAIRIDAMNFFNYLTVISLFDCTSVLDGSLTWLWKLAILFAVFIATFVASILRFDKKDLPL